MTWTAFSAEALALHARIAAIPNGRVVDRLTLIEAALHKAHMHGPSSMSHDDFERSCAAGTLDADVRLAILRGKPLRAAASHRRLASQESMDDVRAAHIRFAEQHEADAAAMR